MHFVAGENGMDARKETSGVVIHTPEFSDDADARLYRNPEGDAYFPARLVATLAGMRTT